MHLFLVVMFAKPVPDAEFVLNLGLFLQMVIDRGWRLYLDRKVMHFAYFYLLSVTIHWVKSASLRRQQLQRITA